MHHVRCPFSCSHTPKGYIRASRCQRNCEINAKTPRGIVIHDVKEENTRWRPSKLRVLANKHLPCGRLFHIRWVFSAIDGVIVFAFSVHIASWCILSGLNSSDFRLIITVRAFFTCLNDIVFKSVVGFVCSVVKSSMRLVSVRTVVSWLLTVACACTVLSRC